MRIENPPTNAFWDKPDFIEFSLRFSISKYTFQIEFYAFGVNVNAYANCKLWMCLPATVLLLLISFIGCAVAAAAAAAADDESVFHASQNNCQLHKQFANRMLRFWKVIHSFTFGHSFEFKEWALQILRKWIITSECAKNKCITTLNVHRRFSVIAHRL